MLTLDEIVSLLQDRRLSKVSEITGITRAALWNLREGKATNPRYSTIKTLSDYFKSSTIHL